MMDIDKQLDQCTRDENMWRAKAEMYKSVNGKLLEVLVDIQDALLTRDKVSNLHELYYGRDLLHLADLARERMKQIAGE